VFPWDPVNSFRLAEVLNHHLDTRAYTVSFFFVMNQDRFDELPADVQACIDESSGDALVARFGDWWDDWDAPGREAAEARGSEIRVLSDEERERWREALQPMIEAYLDQLEGEGVDNAREIYDAMQGVAQMSRLSQRALAILAALLAGGVLVLMLRYGYDTFERRAMMGDRSQQLGIPIAWYWWPLLVGQAAAILAVLPVIVHLLRGNGRGESG
jgi:hypothetical protein